MFSQRLLNHECVVLRSAAHNMSAQGILHQTTYISNSEKGARDPSLTFCKTLGHLLLMQGPIEPKPRNAPTRRAVCQKRWNALKLPPFATKVRWNKTWANVIPSSSIWLSSCKAMFSSSHFFKAALCPADLPWRMMLLSFAPPAAAKIATHLCLHAHTAS